MASVPFHTMIHKMTCWTFCFVVFKTTDSISEGASVTYDICLYAMPISLCLVVPHVTSIEIICLCCISSGSLLLVSQFCKISLNFCPNMCFNTNYATQPTIDCFAQALPHSVVERANALRLPLTPDSLMKSVRPPGLRACNPLPCL